MMCAMYDDGDGIAMDTKQTDWLPLSDTELELYHEQGYLHVKGLFCPDEVALDLAIIDDVVNNGAKTITGHSSFTDRTHTTRVRDAVSQHPGLDYFLDHPKMIGPLVSLFGLGVQILGTEIFVRSMFDEALEDWHTDGGEYLQRVRLRPGSRDLQLKAQIFLTDTTNPETGNFMLIPGSQHQMPQETIATCYIEELNSPWREHVMPPNAITVLAAPGDVLFFPYSLWHAVAPNRGWPRKTFIFRYGQLWHRLGDFGENPHPTDFYKPADQQEIMSGRLTPRPAEAGSGDVS